jgi:hypothetical protein
LFLCLALEPEVRGTKNQKEKTDVKCGREKLPEDGLEPKNKLEFPSASAVNFYLHRCK